jgi:hypothetical protein
MEVQTKQKVQWAIECPQAPSCEDANIVVIKANSGASNHHFLSLFFSKFILIMILGCALGYRS